MSVPNLSLALRNAHDRAKVQNVGDLAWARMQAGRFERTSKLTASFELAEKVSAALVAESKSNGATDQHYERVIFDRNWQQLQGWVLAEKLKRQRLSLQLSGLLLTPKGAVHSYDAAIPATFELPLLPDVLGRIQPTVPMNAEPIKGSFSDEAFGLGSKFDPDEYYQTLHNVSGQLSLTDLLASVIVRHELDESQFIQ